MRTASGLSRAACAALLALLIAVRMLAPAGFMPSFEGGAVKIVACPDAGSPVGPMTGHHNGHSEKAHQQCPYAAGSGNAWLSAGFAAIAAGVVVAAALLVGAAISWAGRSRAFDRPPCRGPPLPA